MFNARSAKKDRNPITRLLWSANESNAADRDRLEALEKELHEAIAECVAKEGEGDKGDQWKTQIAMQHAMRRFERRNAALDAEATKKPEVSPTSSP